MHRLFRRLAVFPILPVYPVFPVVRTFVSAEGMASGGTMSAPSTPPTTRQQILEIFGQPITAEAPKPPEAFPRYGSGLEAATALQELRRQQYKSLMGGLGAGHRAEKEELQSGMMRKESEIIQQLTTRFGIPSHLIPKYK